MAIKSFLSALAGFLFLYAFYPYMKAILKGETKPRKVTWLIWALGDGIILSGMVTQGTISGQMLAACLGASTIFILSLDFGEVGWESRDKVCISLSLAAIGLWQYFGESNLGIAFSLAALLIAAWPTFIGAMEGTEDLRAWVIFSLSSFVAIIAIPHMTFADIAPPIVFMAIDGSILAALLSRRERSSASQVGD